MSSAKMAPEPFRIDGPLPTGTTVLEASAGTGKTWTIAALVTRHVAEAVASLDELLVVTFTRAASQELRERVREQLTEAVAVLEEPSRADAHNTLHQWLLATDDDERVLRRQRLTDALAGFDAATIATIHQFCQVVLRSLGVAGDSDREAVLVDDLSELTRDVVDDLFVRDFAHVNEPVLRHDTALTLGRAVVSDPRARIEPRDALDQAPDTPAAVRVRFASEVREVVAARKRRLGLLGYDDLLSEVADALQDGQAARARMQDRWKVVLVDEFQDTDPVQWEVFSRAFSEQTTMVLIGDPKQAIYGFRGGDVTTYLRASSTASTHQTLDTNHRSDRALVDAVQTIMGGAQLGSDEIAVHPVGARHDERRLTGAGAPIRLRLARRSELGLSPRSKPRIDLWRQHVVTDLARDIHRLLTSDAQFEGEPVRAGHVAVLASKRKELAAVQSALRALGIPSVIGAGGSVFHTPAALEWVTLLEALEQPHRAERVRAAALTSFFGVTASELDADLDDTGRTDELAEQMRHLATLLGHRGVAAVAEYCTVQGQSERVLGLVDGERFLTDLRHVGEILHRTAAEQRLGVVGLLGWLRTQVTDESAVSGERTRRLDSDDAAVQLVTIHGSKGLEYPIVYLPTLWDRWVGKAGETTLFHDDAGERCLDVAGHSPWQFAAVERNRREAAGEALRLMYVAMTRARSQVVLWYAGSTNTPDSELHRMLFGRRPGTAVVPDAMTLFDEERLPQILTHWQEAGAFTWESATHAPVVPLAPEAAREPLAVRRFDRSVDIDWRRTSYSALSAAASTPHAAVAASEPEELPETADAVLLPSPRTETADGMELPSPMADLPVGATFGSLVHAVLEHADPGAEDVRADLLALVREHLVDWPVALDPEELATALDTVVRSPMGPLTENRTLLDVARADRLCELDFELPLAGGDDWGHAADGVDPRSAVVLGDLVDLLRTHLPEGDPVRGYADALEADPTLAAQSLRGYLTGSIDVVMRVGAGPEARYLTVDYKTNWLGSPELPLTAHSYRPAALDEAMAHSDYPLQALLYTVVLHRYLRWRLADYSPERHLGGVLYLYLRGMCGPQTPMVEGHPCGVFSWQAPVPLVLALSDLLDGRPPAATSTTTSGEAR